MTSPRDLARLRLAAQKLVGEPAGSAADAVRWMTCTQAQDYPASLAAVALRTAGGAVAAVTAALDAGDVVRSWPMRGTLHLVAHEDLRWMLEIGPKRVATGAAKRRRDLGIDDTVLATARTATVGVLHGGRRVARDALMKVWRDAGIETDDYRGGHLFGALAVEGLICLGPTSGRRQEVVLVDEWVAPTPARDREEAVAEWALRYFRSHGPATVRDFAWWTGLTLKESREAAQAVAGQLESLEVDGVEHLMDPATPALLDAARSEAAGLLLLPAFDELILGYTDRSAVVPVEHSERVVNGGMFWPAVVRAGTAIGTWRAPRSPSAPPEVSAFGHLTRAVTERVARRWATYPRPA